MAIYKKGAMSDWEFIRAAQIERRECERSHDVAWKVVIGLGNPRSVVDVCLEAYEPAEGGGERLLCRYATEWPNVRAQTFAACVFQASVQLTRLVEDSKRDEALSRTERREAR